MTRSKLIRLAAFTMFGMALNKYDSLAQDGGLLSVDLSKWKWLSISYKGETLAIPVAEVFAAIKEGIGEPPAGQ